MPDPYAIAPNIITEPDMPAPLRFSTHPDYWTGYAPYALARTMITGLGMPPTL